MLILGGTLFDGDESDRIDNCGIRIDNGCIVAVGRRSDFGGPTQNEEVFDCTGRFLMPGLIDMHCHVSNSFGAGKPSAVEQLTGPNGPGGFAPPFKSAPELTIRAVRTVAVLLALGITSARELGGRLDVPLYLRDAIARAEIPGPNLFVCGQPISITGGHGWTICREANGPDDFRLAAREQLKAGADFIKVMASHDPWLMPGPELTRAELSLAEMSAAFNEAHEWGRLACCHAMGSKAISRALEAGVDLVEHGHYLTDDLAEKMASRGVVLTPTLSGYDTQQANPRLQRGDAWIASQEVLIPAHKAGVAAAVRAGVRLTVGTDCAGVYAEEVDLIRQLGASPIESLRACTSNAARALRLEREIGYVREGFRADLVVLRADPLVDPYALEDLELVIKAGRALRPAELAYGDGLAQRPTMMELATSGRGATS